MGSECPLAESQVSCFFGVIEQCDQSLVQHLYLVVYSRAYSACFVVDALSR